MKKFSSLKKIKVDNVRKKRTTFEIDREDQNIARERLGMPLLPEKEKNYVEYLEKSIDTDASYQRDDFKIIVKNHKKKKNEKKG